jgi:phosphoglycerol transferase
LGSKKNKNRGSGRPGGTTATEFKPIDTAVASSSTTQPGAKFSPDFFRGPVFEWLAIAIASALSFWFLTARIVGVQVSVLADEYLYVLDAHYKGLDEATYPNYLFQWIYSSTKMCGTEFYSCARSINAFFVIFGAIFIYLLAKHIGRSKLLAGLAAVAAILGSYGTYTAYFMPEAIFNGLMMVFFWALIRFGKTDNLLVWAAIGTSLGIASLAKPHGLFVVPAVVIFIALWTRASKDKCLIPAVIRNVVFVAAVVGSKFLFGYSLAGERALSLFGMYGTLESVAQTTANVIATAPEAGTSVFFTAWGQVLMITMILGLAFPVAVHGLVLSAKKDAVLIGQVKLRALVGLLLLSLMPAIAIFESWQNLGVWMHTRYYTYLIPLALVALIESLRNQETKLWPWVKYSLTGLFLSLAVFNFFTTAAPYSSNWMDAPDFRTHIDNTVLSSISILIMASASLFWIWKSRVGISIALAVAVVAAIFTGGHITAFLKTNFGNELAFEHVARVLRDFLPQEELDRTLLVGQYEMMQRTIFSSLTGSAEIRSPSAEGLDRKDIDSSKTWLVTIGEQAVTGLPQPSIFGGGYKMYSLDPSNSLIPRTQTIESFSGSCPGSSDVGWSCGIETTIALEESFPAGASVDLIIEISEDLSGQELEFVLGDATISGQFEKGISSLFVKFPNSLPAETLTVRVAAGQKNALPNQSKFIRPIWGRAKPTL